jgi:hypothetical protein
MLFGASALSKNDVWVAGDREGRNGARWPVVNLPGPGQHWSYRRGHDN